MSLNPMTASMTPDILLQPCCCMYCKYWGGLNAPPPPVISRRLSFAGGLVGAAVLSSSSRPCSFLKHWPTTPVIGIHFDAPLTGFD